MNEWICELCFPLHEEIGQIAPGIYLTRTQDTEGTKYYIIGGQGHTGDIYWSSNVRPYPDPAYDTPEDLWENDDLYHKADAWLTQAEPEMYYMKLNLDGTTQSVDTSKLLKGSLRSAWSLVNTLIEGGYDPDKHGDPEDWVYHKMGTLLEEFEAKVANVAEG